MIKISGLDEFLAKIPDYQGKRLALLPIFAIMSFIFSLSLMVLLDITPILFSKIPYLLIIHPFIPILSTIAFEILGLFLISRIWTKKGTYLEKYGGKAYQKAILFVLTGIPIFIASMVHGFIPFNILFVDLSENSISSILATPLFFSLFNLNLPILLIRLIIGILFLSLGLGTVLRSLNTFGLDYMAIIYVYYPEESEVKNQAIYSILRHPTYHGIILISISSIFFRFSIYSILICVLFIFGMYFHIRFIEEKELLERFGKGYLKYIKETPTLFYHPKKIHFFFRFLFKKA